MESLIFLAVIFGIFWFLFIRPQQRRVREHQALVATLEPGDEVVTASGVYGTIRRVDADLVHLEVAPGVEVRLVRGAVSRRIGPPPASADEATDTGDGSPGGS